MVRLGNMLVDESKVSFIYQDEKEPGKVVTVFDNGKEMFSYGDEAVELWRHFDPTPDPESLPGIWKDE